MADGEDPRSSEPTLELTILKPDNNETTCKIIDSANDNDEHMISSNGVYMYAVDPNEVTNLPLLRVENLNNDVMEDGVYATKIIASIDNKAYLEESLNSEIDSALISVVLASEEAYDSGIGIIGAHAMV